MRSTNNYSRSVAPGNTKVISYNRDSHHFHVEYVFLDVSIRYGQDKLRFKGQYSKDIQRN